MTNQDAEREFDSLLKEFGELCGQLTQRGLPYVSVILSHELLRFLYPVEPYANFVNRDPVPFGLQHIRKLIDIGHSWSSAVSPYGKVFELFDPARWHSNVLETKTSNLYSELWKDFDHRVGHTCA